MGEGAHRTWIWIGAAVLAAAAAYALLSAREAERAAAPPVAVRGAQPGTGEGERLWIHVSGAVRRPGLYRLRPGSRVGEAVQRAGGPGRSADLGGLNLAARLQDGQQVAVPRRGARPRAASGLEAGGGGPVSLASATAEELDAIDGIGPTLARRILEYREAHGGFASIDELRQVEGIGEKRFEALRKALQP